MNSGYAVSLLIAGIAIGCFLVAGLAKAKAAWTKWRATHQTLPERVAALELKLEAKLAADASALAASSSTTTAGVVAVNHPG